MGAEGLCGPGHVLSAPTAQKLVLITLQTSRETFHVRAQNLTGIGSKRGHVSCWGPRVPNPVFKRGPRQPEGPVLGTDEERELVLTWKWADFFGNSKGQAQAHSTGHPHVSNPLLGAQEAGRTRPSPPQSCPHGCPRQEARGGGPGVDPSSHQLSSAERRGQWTDEPKRAVGGTGARPPGGHVSLKEGNSGSLDLSGTRVQQQRAQDSAPHSPGSGSQPSPPAATPPRSLPGPRFSPRPSGDNPILHQS